MGGIVIDDRAEIFALPVLDRILIYAPFHSLTALVNRDAAKLIQNSLRTETDPPEPVRRIVSELRCPGRSFPSHRQGPLSDPLFMGIIPTRGCNLNCRYCNFAVPQDNVSMMTLSTARDAVDAYLDLLKSVGQNEAEIHFFGGEPFYAKKIVQFVVEYTNYQVDREGMEAKFEVTTNGLFSEVDCSWIADHFDTVVLSLDGPEDIQELHRPSTNQNQATNIIIQNAKSFSLGPAELIVRACVTNQSVGRMEEIADWIWQTFRPSTVCFEGLTLSTRSAEAGLHPPDPWEFGRHFWQAARILETHGIETVLSTVNLTAWQISGCPVGKDALIISPDGSIDACYQLREDWESQGLDFHLGQLVNQSFKINPGALQSVRDFAARDKPLCADCFCRYHCAGGCHISHPTDDLAGAYDDVCISTRLVTVARLLDRIGQGELATEWLTDLVSAQETVLRENDCLSTLKV
jgi:uncharacterized protein